MAAAVDLGSVVVAQRRHAGPSLSSAIFEAGVPHHVLTVPWEWNKNSPCTHHDS